MIPYLNKSFSTLSLYILQICMLNINICMYNTWDSPPNNICYLEFLKFLIGNKNWHKSCEVSKWHIEDSETCIREYLMFSFQRFLLIFLLILFHGNTNVKNSLVYFSLVHIVHFMALNHNTLELTSMIWLKEWTLKDWNNNYTGDLDLACEWNANQDCDLSISEETFAIFT